MSKREYSVDELLLYAYKYNKIPAILFAKDKAETGTPVDVKKWTELGNVKTYYEFFREHRNEFEDMEE